MADPEPLQHHELQALYTHHVRKHLTESGFRRDEAPPVVRYINRRGTHSLILYSELGGLSDFESHVGQTGGYPVDHYTDEAVGERADEIYRHVFSKYPTLPSPYFSTGVA